MKLAAYTSYSEVYGTEADEDFIIKSLRKMRLSKVLTFASVLDSVLENDQEGRPLEKNTQRLLTGHMFSSQPNIKSIILHLLEEHEFKLVFHKLQLANLSKLAILYSNEDISNEDESIYYERLPAILLMISELSEKSLERKLTGIAPQSSIEDELLTGFVIRNSGFYWRDRLLHALARNFHFYLELASEETLKKTRDYIDIESEFNKVTGLPLLHYFSLAGAILYLHSRQSVIKNEINPTLVWVNKTNLMSDKHPQFNSAQKMLELVSDTPDRIRNRLEQEIAETGNKWYTFGALIDKPLVRFPGEKFILLNSPFLREKTTSELYWMLFTHLKSRGYNEHLKLARFDGIIFQKYVQNMFLRLYSTNCHTEKERCFLEQTYDRPERKSSDVHIFFGSSAIFIEVSKAQMNIRSTVVSGNLQSFEKDLYKIVCENAKQIHRSISDFKNSMYSFEGIENNTIRDYYPVIVVPRPLPLLEPIWLQRIEPILKRYDYLQNEFIKPLQICSVDELESIEGFLNQGHSLLKLLQDKIEANKYGDFNSFMGGYYPGVSKQNVFIIEAFARLGSAMREFLFPN